VVVTFYSGPTESLSAFETLGDTTKKISSAAGRRCVGWPVRMGPFTAGTYGRSISNPARSYGRGVVRADKSGVVAVNRPTTSVGVSLSRATLSDFAMAVRLNRPVVTAFPLLQRAGRFCRRRRLCWLRVDLNRNTKGSGVLPP